jgi:hypothetical protein
MGTSERYGIDGERYDVTTIPGYVDTWSVCPDCYLAVHDVLENPDPEWPGMAVDLSGFIVDGARTWWDDQSGEAYTDPYYVRPGTACETCGDPRGGDRYDVDSFAR